MAIDCGPGCKHECCQFDSLVELGKKARGRQTVLMLHLQARFTPGCAVRLCFHMRRYILTRLIIHRSTRSGAHASPTRSPIASLSPILPRVARALCGCRTHCARQASYVIRALRGCVQDLNYREFTHQHGG